MKNLTDRQEQLLTAIIREFMDTAEAVGSIHLPDKYQLGVSSATVRNEMMKLAKAGLVKKSHASSGRVPTSQGFKYFIDELLDEVHMMNSETEAKVRESIFQHRFNVEDFMYQIVYKLAEITGAAAIVVFNGKILFTNLSSIIDLPEYDNVRKIKNLLVALEDAETFSSLFDASKGEKDITILIGKEDTGMEAFEEAAILFGKLECLNDSNAYIGIIGPSRMDYAYAIPRLKWMIETAENSLN